MKLFYFFCLFLFVLLTEAGDRGFSKKNNKIKHKTDKPEESFSLENSSRPKEKKGDNKEDCSVSGQELIYSHNFSSTGLNISSSVGDWFKKSLPYVKKNPLKHCPKRCKQINSYQALSKTYPKTVKKGSCKGKEAKEIYFLEKKFLFLKNKMERTHEEMLEWLLGTFIYPFFPIFEMDSTKEAFQHNIPAACPSCSFYFDYSYKYIEGKGLDLAITARCGDMKRLISRFKFEFTLVNNWKCKDL